MRLLLLVAAALPLAAPPALAQSDSSVALGLAFAVTSPTNTAAADHVRPALLLRLRGSSGLGPSVGFHWFATNVRTTIAGRQAYLGKVSIRPVMFGATFSRHFSRMAAGVSLQAGYAFTKVRNTGEARQEYARVFGSEHVGMHASNAFAWSTGFSTWFELGARCGLLASVGYVGVRPTVHVTAGDAGATRQRLNLGSVVTTFGLVFGVF